MAAKSASLAPTSPRVSVSPEQQVYLTFVVGLLIVASVAAAAMWWTSPAGEIRFEDTAAILGLVTLAAVGIERTLEVLWTVIGVWKGDFWPLRGIHRRASALETALDARLAPLFPQVKNAVAGLQPGVSASQEYIIQLRDKAGRLELEIQRLQQIAHDRKGLQRLSNAASEYAALAESALSAAGQNIAAVAPQLNSAIEELEKFVDSFEANPGRRLISIWVGIIIGIVVAAWLELDLFAAALAVEGGTTSSTDLKVILTGVIIGLGASPTHEVIRAIQEYKESRKTAQAQA